MKTRTLICLLALAFAPAASATYKCVDEKGVTRIGETPPDECGNVPMHEISRSGQVLRTIAPSLTAEQVKALQETAEKRKQEEKRAFEQARKDEALLSTYASDREIDMTRDRNIDPINGRIKVTRERLDGVDKRVKQLEEEMEFYKQGKSRTTTSKSGKSRGDEPPAQLTHDLQRLKGERVALEKSLAGYDKEIEAMRAKYDGDKRRWLELKAAGPAKPTATSATR